MAVRFFNTSPDQKTWIFNPRSTRISGGPHAELGNSVAPFLEQLRKDVLAYHEKLKKDFLRDCAKYCETAAELVPAKAVGAAVRLVSSVLNWGLGASLTEAGTLVRNNGITVSSGGGLLWLATRLLEKHKPQAAGMSLHEGLSAEVKALFGETGRSLLMLNSESEPELMVLRFKAVDATLAVIRALAHHHSIDLRD